MNELVLTLLVRLVSLPDQELGYLVTGVEDGSDVVVSSVLNPFDGAESGVDGTVDQTEGIVNGEVAESESGASGIFADNSHAASDVKGGLDGAVGNAFGFDLDGVGEFVGTFGHGGELCPVLVDWDAGGLGSGFELLCGGLTTISGLLETCQAHICFFAYSTSASALAFDFITTPYAAEVDSLMA